MAAEPDDWWDEAACREAGPALFYPVGTTGPALEQIADAKAVCATCPVIRDCLEWALAHREDHGVWGGTDEFERQSLRRRLRRRELAEMRSGVRQLNLLEP